MASQSYSDLKSSQREAPSLLSRVSGQIQLMYYQYEVTFSAYVLTPGEKFVMNTIVLIFLSLLMMGTVFYLPRFLTRVASRLVWLYTGPPDKLRLVTMSNTTATWNQLGLVMSY